MEHEKDILVTFRDNTLSIDCTFDYDEEYGVENLYYDKVMKVQRFEEDIKPYDFKHVLDRYEKKYPNSELMMFLEKELEDLLYDKTTNRNIEFTYEY